MNTSYAPSVFDGKLLPVTARFESHDWSATVLYRIEASHEWELQWTDGINVWVEEWIYAWHAYARLAALVAAVEQDVFLVHGSEEDHAAFVDEVERFVARTVHAFNCPPGCVGDSPHHDV